MQTNLLFIWKVLKKTKTNKCQKKPKKQKKKPEAQANSNMAYSCYFFLFRILLFIVWSHSGA